MHIHPTSKVRKRILEYHMQMLHSVSIKKFLFAPIMSGQVPVFRAEEVQALARTFLETVNGSGLSFTHDEAVIGSMLYRVLEEFTPEEGPPKGAADPNEPLDLDTLTHRVIPDEVIDRMIRQGRVFHEGEAEAVSYCRTVQCDGRSCGDYTLTWEIEEPYDLFFYDNPKILKGGLVIPCVGTLDYRRRNPLVKYKGRSWRSLMPDEIIMMQDAISKAQGNVLALGSNTGLGYFAFMASEKETVSHVTVVEEDPELAAFFTSCTLPQFPHKEKITVIQANPESFMKELPDGEYDFCFEDCFAGVGNAISYVRMKKICHKFRQTEVAYFIEDYLMDKIMWGVFLIILDEFSRADGIPFSYDDDEEAVESELMKSLREMLRLEEIRRPRDVDRLMDPDTIKKMISE